jgi:spore germination protein YaaH
MGWSRLDYTTAGTAKLDTATTEYKVPEGFGEVVQAADRAHLRKDLMVYMADGQKLAAFLKDAPAQKTFIGQLAAKLADPAFGFTGVCIDFEGLMEAADAPHYLQFIQNVKSGIGGKSLSVAVPTDFYYKGYDFKGLGETADTVILMAYDFTHDASRLPSAPLPYVREGLERALKLVPKEKLVLGISKQANQWITANGATVMERPSIDRVEQRLADPKAVQSLHLPYFLKQIRYQEGGSASLIYYEDAASIAKKIWLAKVYGLKGVSLWYMGNFTAADWDVIAKR